MKLNLLDLINDVEIEYSNYLDCLLNLYSHCSGNSMEVFGVYRKLTVSTVENIEGFAYELQEELKKIENDNRLKYWVDNITTLCQEIIDLFSIDGPIPSLSNFDFDKESTEIKDKPIFDNDDLESYLEAISENAFEELQLLLVEAEADLVELAEKLKQLLILLKGMLS